MALPYNPVLSIGKEAFISCPFNPEHKMCESSLQRHIVRCMVNYPDYISCPYNALHFFRTKDILEKHLEYCPCKPFPGRDDKIMDNQEALIHAANLRNLRCCNLELENWDKEN